MSEKKIIDGKECTLLETATIRINDEEKDTFTREDISIFGKIKIDISLNKE